jgi:hypothetical protein
MGAPPSSPTESVGHAGMDGEGARALARSGLLGVAHALDLAAVTLGGASTKSQLAPRD